MVPNHLNNKSYAANNIATMKINYRNDVLSHKIEEASDSHSNIIITNVNN